ncbi:ATP-binding protein [Actinoalloteichus spitiensis]|uniref:ATP-binding protein n=1 Tax=Actinoalloteichus spitiensis TaxID=252394 RepID=UPI000A2F675D
MGPVAAQLNSNPDVRSDAADEPRTHRAASQPPHGGAPSSREHPASRVPLRRRRSARALAGVAGGVADHLGVKVLWVRAFFALLTVWNGVGLLAYALLWAFIPQRPVDTGKDPSSSERQQTVAVVMLGIGALVAAGSFGSMFVVPLLVVLVGGAVVWREADDAQRRRWAAGARSGMRGVFVGQGGRSALARTLAGSALVVTGIALFLVGSLDLNQLQFGLLAVIATLAGAAVLTVPWWLRTVRALDEERRARIRSQERAEIAAHLHDSVLQTLALIQKQAEDTKEVRRLARSQERQLRGWLYGPSGYGRGGSGGSAAGPQSPTGSASPAADPTDSASAAPHSPVGRSLSEVIAEACGEVEDTFAIKVQQVVVGDCVLDERIAAAVSATREAVVNAAKHAEVGEVSVYVEVEPSQVEFFVRDRGKGFDQEAVPADRHGVADSIRGRMERNGGSARIRTAPGEGTEVQLRVPRDANRQ